MTDRGDPGYRLILLPWLRRPGHYLLLPNWLAITIGRWIFAWRELNDAELAHELAHVGQWRRYGLRFIPRYLRASWNAAWPEGGDSYRDNRFEVEARAAADAARRKVGVYNPAARGARLSRGGHHDESPRRRQG